uniref:Uncharacterized protein n=1 Tax=Tanacetum cinerariifolium TaxID=118510 RepID=A0A6L2KXC5_TANCI|nr:hypothetical protein [Tanacetum cinerariifolium]
MKKGVSEIKGKVPTEMELVLEQTQQGTSYKVSVSTEGLKNEKRNVRIKSEKKESLHTLRQKPERFDTLAGSPVKEIPLKLNLPYHMSILRDLKKFWDSVLIKKSNDAVKLQALIDKKKVIITEDTIRQALRLNDADGVFLGPMEVPHSHEPQSAQPSSPLHHQPKVANLEQDNITQALEITKLKQRVKKLEKKRGFKSSGFKRLRKDTDEAEHAEVEEVLKVVTVVKLMTEVQSKDKGKGILIEEPKLLKGQAQIDMDEAFDNEVMRYQALKRKPLTEAQARKNMMIYLKNMVGFKMDFFKGMTYSEIRPLFKKHYNSIQAFLEKGKEEVEVQEEGSKRKEPRNFSDDFLLNTLKIMFEKPNVEANVWRDQKSRYGLAKKYPLTHFTLEQMLNNVRLEVKEESEMSLKLLRLVRRQLNEGYVPE